MTAPLLWTVEPVHHGCAPCDRAARSAITLATVTGSLSASCDAGEGHHAARVSRPPTVIVADAVLYAGAVTS